MEETSENAQGQKPKLCKLAIASPLVVILGFLVAIGLASSSGYGPYLGELNSGGVVLLVSSIMGLILGIVACRKINKNKGLLKGRGFSIPGIGLALVCFNFLIFPPALSSSRGEVECTDTLAGLGKAIHVYSDRHGKYPDPNMWCDLIAEHTERSLAYWLVPKNGDYGYCPYTLNPNCSLNSPGDVVLLFKTRGNWEKLYKTRQGWNRFGGPELMSTECCERKGCHVLFNNGDVKFIKKRKFGKLKWGNEPKKE